MKQTAVEWLVEQFAAIRKQNSGYRNIKTEFKELIEQAKEMEKEQIIDAYNNGDNRSAELYYNETFKSVKHNTDIRSMDKLIESNKKFDENNLKGFKYDPNDRSEDTPDITNFFY